MNNISVFRKRSKKSKQETSAIALSEYSEKPTNYKMVPSESNIYTGDLMASRPKKSRETILLLALIYVVRNPSTNENPLKWIISYSEITIEYQIGKGAFGVVHKGEWRGIKVASNSTYLVITHVVKHLQEMSQEQHEQFKAEAALMASLRPHGLNYFDLLNYVVNIVTFLGVTMEPPCIVT